MADIDANSKAQTYGDDFYRDRRSKTLHSARRVLGPLFDALAIDSVVDFGCGTATWLSVAKELGATRVRGVEGQWLDKTKVDIPAEQVMTWELEKPVALDARFDLAISLEVAEHLSKARAQTFVDDLCRAADCVLFSAAVPGQGGELHINEEWQSAWVERFSKNDYSPIDLIRPSIWNDKLVPFWYKQNTILYATGDSLVKLSENSSTTKNKSEFQFDIIHPDLYKQYAPYNVKRALRDAARIPVQILRKIRH